MIICACTKCKYVDLLEHSDDRVCMRCGAPYFSLELTSREWNLLTDEERKDVVDEKFNEANPELANVVLEIPKLKPEQVKSKKENHPKVNKVVPLELPTNRGSEIKQNNIEDINDESAPKEKKSSLRVWIICLSIVGVLLLAGLIVGIVMISSNKKESSSPVSVGEEVKVAEDYSEDDFGEVDSFERADDEDGEEAEEGESYDEESDDLEDVFSDDEESIEEIEDISEEDISEENMDEENDESMEEDSDEESEEGSEDEEADKIDIDDIDITFSDSVENDSTGNWRLAQYDSPEAVELFIADYYNKYFGSDDEVHAVINSSLNTTTEIMKVGDFLDIRTHEYVDGEEKDAESLFGGSVIAEFFYYLSSGELQKIQ